MEAIEQQLLEFVRLVYGTLGWPGVVALMAIESACIPLPSEIIMPLAGWMLIRDRGQDLSLLLLAGFAGALGNLLGSLVAYAVGAYGGRSIFERYGKYVLVTRHDLDRADRWFAKYGDAAIFFSRLLPVVRTFISFPAGVSRMNIWKFSLYTFLGAFPWSLGLAYGGYVLGEHWEQLRTVMRPFDIPIILVILALVAWYVVRHVRRANSEKETEKQAAP